MSVWLTTTDLKSFQNQKRIFIFIDNAYSKMSIANKIFVNFFFVDFLNINTFIAIVFQENTSDKI